MVFYPSTFLGNSSALDYETKKYVIVYIIIVLDSGLAHVTNGCKKFNIKCRTVLNILYY